MNIFIKRDVYHFPDQVDFGTLDREKLAAQPQLHPFLTQTLVISQRPRKSANFTIQVENPLPFVTVSKSPEGPSPTYRPGGGPPPGAADSGKY